MPLHSFKFLAPLSLQVVLLHPIFPAQASRILRLALTPASLYLCWKSAIDHGVQPADHAVGINFVIGVMSSYGIWKSIEWGTASDLSPYTYVGFEEAKEGRAVAPKKERKELEAIRAKQAEADSPIDILRWSGLLLVSMRGNGWAFGPAEHMLAAHYPTEAAQFVPQLLAELLRAHVTLVTCGAVLLLQEHGRVDLIESIVHLVAPTITFSKSAQHISSEALATLAIGTGVFAGLSLGYTFATLLSWILLATMRSALPASLAPQPFDTRHYPPLFQTPWRVSSVGRFWVVSWHSFFSRSFSYLGMKPFSKIGTRFGGKQVGRTLGVMVVFSLSAWLHEHALWTATRSWPYPADAGLVTRWGSTAYFLLQGVAIVLEGAFTAVTGRKVGGMPGRIWGYCVMAGLGYLVYLSW